MGAVTPEFYQLVGFTTPGRQGLGVYVCGDGEQQAEGR